MAGRPRKRAKKGEPKKDDPSWAESLAGDLLNTPPIPAAPGDLVPVPPKPPSDREYLAQWWRDQVEEIERGITDRRALLSVAFEHPNEIFAQQAKVFGALGVPKDVVATLLGLRETDFEAYYGADYGLGDAEMIGRVATNLLRIATSTDDRYAVKAAIEVMNRRGKEEWRAPAQKLEIDDTRKKKPNLIDSSQLSFEDRRLLREIIMRSMSSAPAGLAPPQHDEAEEA
jgi:hypothetical protein